MHIGSWSIQPYTLRIGYGVLAALIWLSVAGIKRGLTYRRLTGLLWSVTGGLLLFGRAGYALFNVEYFMQRPEDLVALRDVGGIHGLAAWIGGALAGWLWARATGCSLRATIALLAPVGLLLAAGGWWACADRGCVWSAPVLTPPPLLRWMVVDRPDLYHTVAPRYAIATLGALWALLCAGIGMLWRGHVLFCVSFYAIGVALLSSLRADPVVKLVGLRLDVLLHLFLGGGLLVLQWIWNRDQIRERFVD